MGGDGGVELRDVTAWETIRWLTHPSTPGARAVGFSSDGSLVASSSKDAILIWDRSGFLLKSMIIPGEVVTSLAFHPNGMSLASGCSAGAISLWDLSTQKPTARVLTPMSHAVTHLSFDPTGRFLAASAGGVRLYRVGDGGSIWVDGYREIGKDRLVVGTDSGLVERDAETFERVRYRRGGDWLQPPMVEFGRVREIYHREGILAAFLRGE